VKLLNRFFSVGKSDHETHSESKVARSFGEDFLKSLAGKTVIDFGCGEGRPAIELAQYAKRVIGIDIREDVLQVARRRATEAGVENNCAFTQRTTDKADVIISLDTFEHFSDPAGVLLAMRELLKPGGQIAISFGPTWYHPLGGHLFSVFPWAHLVFSEQALIQWRSGFKADGATRFSEVAGGLNQITIRRFEKIVKESHLQLSEMECVPIRKLRWLHNRFSREFATAVVRCRLAERPQRHQANPHHTRGAIGN
jgi:SAM-dependent methyltransferase